MRLVEFRILAGVDRIERLTIACRQVVLTAVGTALFEAGFESAVKRARFYPACAAIDGICYSFHSEGADHCSVDIDEITHGSFALIDLNDTGPIDIRVYHTCDCDESIGT